MEADCCILQGKSVTLGRDDIFAEIQGQGEALSPECQGKML